MIRKIMELSKLNKYDDSVKKESEIDDLHAKYIKTRLACIDWFCLINYDYSQCYDSFKTISYWKIVLGDVNTKNVLESRV